MTKTHRTDSTDSLNCYRYFCVSVFFIFLVFFCFLIFWFAAVDELTVTFGAHVKMGTLKLQDWTLTDECVGS